MVVFKIEVFNALRTRFGLQNIPLSKQPCKTQPQIEYEDVTWSPQYNLLTTRTKKRRALSLQEVKLDGWFLILHIMLETCTTLFMHKFNMGLIFHFYTLGLTSWIWRSSSTETLKFKSPSKWTLVRASILNTGWWYGFRVDATRSQSSKLKPAQKLMNAWCVLLLLGFTWRSFVLTPKSCQVKASS